MNYRKANKEYHQALSGVLNRSWAVLAIPLCMALPAQADMHVKVTVENLAGDAGGTFFTPVWMGFHSGDFDAFNSAQVASSEIEALAEGGNVAPLDTLFGSAGGRLSTTLAAPGGPGPGIFAPGSSASTTISLNAVNNRYFSYASMLVPSNDAFVGNDSPTLVELFNGAGSFNGSATFTIFGADVWDSGTELNDTFGAPFSTIGGISTDEAGVIAQHSGLGNFVGTTTGSGQLLSSDFDFGAATPIAQVTFEAIPEPSSAVLLVFSSVALFVARRHLPFR